MRNFSLTLTTGIVALMGVTLWASRPSEMLQRADRALTAGEYTTACTTYDSILNTPKLRQSLKFQALSGRASARKNLADYGGAIADYDSTLSIAVSPRNHAIMKLNKSDLLLMTGQYDEARRLLDTLDTDSLLYFPDIRLRTRENRATLLTRLGEYGQAADIYRSLIDTVIPGSDQTLIRQNLGFLLLTMGNGPEGREELQKALSLAEFNTNPSVKGAIILSNLALAEGMTGNYSKAITDIDRALAYFSKTLGESHPDYITALRKKAEIELMHGDSNAALDIFKPYFSLLRGQIAASFPAMTEQARLDYWKKERPLLSEMFATGNEDPAFLLDVSLLRRAVALTGADKAFGKKSADKLAITGQDLKRALRTGETAVDFVVYPALDSVGGITERMGMLIVTPTLTRFADIASIADMEKWRVKGRGFGQAIRSLAYPLKDAIYNDTRLFNRIWGNLVETAPDSRDIYFVPDGLLNLVAIESLNIPDSLQSRDYRFHRLTTLANLTDRQKKPATGTAFVAGGISYDTIAGDEMQRANHDALHYMVRVNNGRQIIFDALAGMRSEAHAVDSILRDSHLTSVVTEEDFRKLDSGYSRLHIATHGYTLGVDQPRQPLLLRDSLSADNSLLASGLVLTGANVAGNDPRRDDGLLSAREICDMDLSNIDFAVLAACQTALGETEDEGPVGLVRGLKKAGVHTIMATLWQVDDQATYLFMTTFYDALNRGMSKYDAYRHAGKTVREYTVTKEETRTEFDPATGGNKIIKTGKTVTEHPFSSPNKWAPFILIDAI